MQNGRRFSIPEQTSKPIFRGKLELQLPLPTRAWFYYIRGLSCLKIWAGNQIVQTLLLYLLSCVCYIHFLVLLYSCILFSLSLVHPKMKSQACRTSQTMEVDGDQLSNRKATGKKQLKRLHAACLVSSESPTCCSRLCDVWWFVCRQFRLFAPTREQDSKPFLCELFL